MGGCPRYGPRARPGREPRRHRDIGAAPRGDHINDGMRAAQRDVARMMAHAERFMLQAPLEMLENELPPWFEGAQAGNEGDDAVAGAERNVLGEEEDDDDEGQWQGLPPLWVETEIRRRAPHGRQDERLQQLAGILRDVRRVPSPTAPGLNPRGREVMPPLDQPQPAPTTGPRPRTPIPRFFPPYERPYSLYSADVRRLPEPTAPPSLPDTTAANYPAPANNNMASFLSRAYPSYTPTPPNAPRPSSPPLYNPEILHLPPGLPAYQPTFPPTRPVPSTEGVPTPANNCVASIFSRAFPSHAQYAAESPVPPAVPRRPATTTYRPTPLIYGNHLTLTYQPTGPAYGTSTTMFDNIRRLHGMRVPASEQRQADEPTYPEPRSRPFRSYFSLPDTTLPSLRAAVRQIRPIGPGPRGGRTQNNTESRAQRRARHEERTRQIWASSDEFAVVMDRLAEQEAEEQAEEAAERMQWEEYEPAYGQRGHADIE